VIACIDHPDDQSKIENLAEKKGFRIQQKKNKKRKKKCHSLNQTKSSKRQDSTFLTSTRLRCAKPGHRDKSANSVTIATLLTVNTSFIKLPKRQLNLTKSTKFLSERIV